MQNTKLTKCDTPQNQQIRIPVQRGRTRVLIIPLLCNLPDMKSKACKSTVKQIKSERGERELINITSPLL